MACLGGGCLHRHLDAAFSDGGAAGGGRQTRGVDYRSNARSTHDQGWQNRTRKALLMIALIVGMLAVLTFAAPYNQFLQKAAQPVTGNTNEITYCHLVQNRERLDQNLIICRFNLLNDLP